MQPETDPDAETMEGIRNHDEQALQALLRKYYPHLCKYAHSLLRHHGLAEEAVSNVFINIWSRRHSLTITSTVRAYLFSSAGNQALKMRSRQIRTDTVSIEDVPSEELVDGHETDADIMYRELSYEIERLVEAMPAQRRRIFRMSRFDNMRHREIAEALRLSEYTVQNHIVEAHRQLLASFPQLAEWLKGGPRK